MELNQEALSIIETLESAGFEAYAVGGCVRDSLLGLVPKDIDITTSARPEQVKALFPRTFDTGIEHGTVTVLMRNGGYEVTTFRTDGKYTDHRRPDHVEYALSLEDDLSRRDFTINAMAYHPEKGLVDLFGGMEDLEAGIIRCVGDPKQRFDEDALRMLRAVRFAAKLSTEEKRFEIHEDTKQAILAQARFLQDISAERIREELTKLICSDHPERLEDAYELGVTAQVLPEFDRMMETGQNNIHHIYDVGHHTIAVMQAVDPTPVLRYAALLHDSAKPDCKTTDEREIDGKMVSQDHFKGHPQLGKEKAGIVLRRLKMDNATRERVERLVEWHDYGLKGDIQTKRALRRGLHKMGPDLFDDYMQLRRADIAGQSARGREKSLEICANMEAMYREIMEEGEALSIADLKVGGKDLMDIGIPAGPKLGETLKELLDQVLEDPAKNDRETLLEFAKKSAGLD